MGQPGPSAIAAPADSEGRLDADIECLSCGYNLRQVRHDDHCPECGGAAADSALGGRVYALPLDWLRRVDDGISGLMLATVLLVLPPLALFGLIGFTVTVLQVTSGTKAWDPRRARRLRRLASVSLGAAGVFFIAVFVDAVSGGSSDAAIMRRLLMLSLLLLCLAGAVALAAGYCGRLAQALGLAQLAQDIRATAWFSTMGPALLVATMAMTQSNRVRESLDDGVTALLVVSLGSTLLLWLALLTRLYPLHERLKEIIARHPHAPSGG